MASSIRENGNIINNEFKFPEKNSDKKQKHNEKAAKKVSEKIINKQHEFIGKTEPQKKETENLGDLLAIEEAFFVEELMMIGKYKIEVEIGKGSFGKVYRGINTETGDYVALKRIKQSNLKGKKTIMRTQREINIQKLLKHPHIVELKDVIKDVKTGDTFIILEYINGGELFDYIIARHRVREKEARGFFRQIISGLEYCHANLVIHRDLKPENLLITGDGKIKISDFGLSNTMDPGSLMSSFCGSPLYVSPEVINKSNYIGPEVDIWSLGVILFCLVTGLLPWRGETTEHQFYSILNDPIIVPPYVSQECTNLILGMLNRNPAKRITIPAIRKDDWVNFGYNSEIPSYFETDRPEVTDIDPEIVTKLESMSFKVGPDERKEIMKNKNTQVAATYHLLLQQQFEKNHVEETKVVQTPVPETHSPEFSARPRSRSNSLSVSVATDDRPRRNSDGFSVKKLLPKFHRDRTSSATQRRSSISGPSDRLSNSGGSAIKKDKQSTSSAQLRVVQGVFNVETCSGLPPSKILKDVKTILKQKRIKFTASDESEYILHCKIADIEFELEICKINKLQLNGVRLKRTAGDLWAYKTLCDSMLSVLKI